MKRSLHCTALMLIDSSYKIDGLISLGICVNSMQIPCSAYSMQTIIPLIRTQYMLNKNKEYTSIM